MISRRLDRLNTTRSRQPQSRCAGISIAALNAPRSWSDGAVSRRPARAARRPRPGRPRRMTGRPTPPRPSRTCRDRTRCGRAARTPSAGALVRPAPGGAWRPVARAAALLPPPPASARPQPPARSRRQSARSCRRAVAPREPTRRRRVGRRAATTRCARRTRPVVEHGRATPPTLERTPRHRGSRARPAAQLRRRSTPPCSRPATGAAVPPPSTAGAPRGTARRP